MNTESKRKTAVLVVHDWYTCCGTCGYGSGGWSNAPNPILTPESTVCHGCGGTFTRTDHSHSRTGYTSHGDTA